MERAMNRRQYGYLRIFGFLLVGLGITLFAMNLLNVDKAILDIFKAIGLVCSGLVAVFFISRLIIGVKKR